MINSQIQKSFQVDDLQSLYVDFQFEHFNPLSLDDDFNLASLPIQNIQKFDVDNTLNIKHEEKENQEKKQSLNMKKISQLSLHFMFQLKCFEVSDLKKQMFFITHENRRIYDVIQVFLAIGFLMRKGSKYEITPLLERSYKRKTLSLQYMIENIHLN